METYLPKRVHRYWASVFDVRVLRSRFRFDVGDLKPTLVLGCPVKPISPYPKSSTKNMITLGRFVFSERDDEMKRERSKSRFLIF